MTAPSRWSIRRDRGTRIARAMRQGYERDKANDWQRSWLMPSRCGRCRRRVFLRMNPWRWTDAEGNDHGCKQ